MKTRLLTWTWVVLGWMLGTTLWTMAFLVGGADPLDALPFGATQMAAAALMSLGIWRLSAAVPWNPRSAAFLATHLAVMMLFATTFTAVQGFIWAARDGRSVLWGIGTALSSPVTGWNILMGDLIYLAIAGICYTRRVAARLQAARDAQLAALHARLQPHFLFNALHTVGALVHDDPEGADRAVDELGRLLRYALRDPGEEVTLRTEWDFARDYLSFERLRLGDRLRLATEIDEDALDCRAPSFLIQPLVENAVRHGVADSPGGGAVSVKLARSDGSIRIQVRNSAGAGPGSGGTGSGLRLLRERLDLAYSGAASLKVERGAEFVVTVTLPAEPALR